MNKLLKTRNIKKSLKKFADKNSIEVSKLDFKLRAIETYVKEISNEDFIKLNDDQQEYEDKKRILNEHIEFQQIHTIEITPKTNKAIKLNYAIEYGTFSTHPKIVLEANSIIPYKKYPIKQIYMLLVQEFNKIKAENSILIKIFDEDMTKTLKAFAKHLYAGKFTKKIKIPLFDGIKPHISKDPELIILFEQNKDDNQLIEVEGNETLAQFIKPKYGQNGLNAFGEFLDSNNGSKKHNLDAHVDEESIEIIENDDEKLYRSRRKGFVNYDGTNLSVENKVKKQKLSRLESALAEEESNDIEVQVSQHDSDLDTVGEGVQLKSQTVHVTGHIGAKSIIEAVDLKIEGATHQDSKQFAKSATINRHKGTLRCNEANISLLEGGEVHATTANIDSCLGGVVYAQDVTISNVKNNLKVYASNSITVKYVSGEDNQFTICYKEIDILNSKVNFLEKDIENVKELIEEAEKREPEKLKELQTQVSEFKAQKEAIINSVNKAKITITKPLKGHNTITFVLPNDQELVYKTQAQEYETFHLDITEEKITLKPVNISIDI